MSSKSQFPRGAKGPMKRTGGQAFTDMLKNAAEKAKEVREGEDSGIPPELPKPLTQTILDDRFEWLWQVMGVGIHIIAICSRENENWRVRMQLSDKNWDLSADETREIGEALLAAYAWKDIWKLHVADYMLGEKTVDLKVVEPEENSGEEYPSGYPELGG